MVVDHFILFPRAKLKIIGNSLLMTENSSFSEWCFPTSVILKFDLLLPVGFRLNALTWYRSSSFLLSFFLVTFEFSKLLLA